MGESRRTKQRRSVEARLGDGHDAVRRVERRDVPAGGAGLLRTRREREPDGRTRRAAVLDAAVELAEAGRARVARREEGAMGECVDRYGGLIWSLTTRLSG